MYRNQHLITESERERILGLYNTKPSFDWVITEWLSPDEKYVIFLDELYHIEKKEKIGNIWENIENLKFFIKHSFSVAENIPNEIMESVNSTLNELVITESNSNFTGLKSHIKELMLNEGVGDWASAFGGWVKDTAKSAVTGTTEFFKKSYNGVKDIVKGISEGEWMNVIKLVGKGALYVARSIRSALYHPIGLILDAILVATGIGKAAQFVIWGIVVALDIYELMSGDYEDKNESFLVRLLFTGIDILGLVFAGVAAKSGKGLIASVLKKFGTSVEGLAKAAKVNGAFKSTLESILKSATSASSKMKDVTSFLQQKSPMLYKFVSKILGPLAKFAEKIVNSIKAILKGSWKAVSAPGKSIEKVVAKKFGEKAGTGAKAAFNTSALVAGVGTIGKKLENDNKLNLTPTQVQNLELFNNINKYYGDKDPFDM